VNSEEREEIDFLLAMKVFIDNIQLYFLLLFSKYRFGVFGIYNGSKLDLFFTVI
jgi:hypothetical protein